MPRHVLRPLSNSLTGHREPARRQEAFAGDAWRRLDQVQELGIDGEAHTGCVNALSWSDDGGILLSGSDDKRICIWTANPRGTFDSSYNALGDPDVKSPHPLKLTDTIVTGHTRNIFSARFLPNTNTPTIVSCAGDSEVRVFEVERLSSVNMKLARARGSLWGVEGPGVRVLSCHTDRTKRIATEVSPHLFLTVSEDGTVRQHDLRRPHQCRSECPDPLFRAPPGVDLYSLSVSAVAPHTFAVAGQTDCAYICDRRMPEHQTPSWGTHTKRAGQVWAVRRLGLPDDEWSTREKRYRERHITCVKMNPHRADEVICAFANHSTSLFSLHDSPIEPRAAESSTPGVLSPNASKTEGDKRRSTSASPTASKPASPTTTRKACPKRSRAAMREGSSSSTSEAERISRPRTDEGPSPDMNATLSASPGSSHSTTEGPETGPSRPDLDSLQALAEDIVSMGQDVDMDSEDDRRELGWEPDDDSDEELDVASLLRNRYGVDGAFIAANAGEEDDEETANGEAMDFEADGADEFDDDSDLDDFGDEDDNSDMGFTYPRGADSSDGQFAGVGMLHPRHIFRGARNVETVKDCNFLGDYSNKVASGSDDGNFFVWDKNTGELEGIWKGDGDVVNVMEQHPTLPLIAVSGIDNTVKMFAPSTTKPKLSFNRTPLAEGIIRRNLSRPRDDLNEGRTSILHFLSTLVTSRNIAPNAEDRQRLVQFLRATGVAEEDDDDSDDDSDDSDAEDFLASWGLPRRGPDM